MASTVRFGVPYKVTVRANDLGSGKPITNALYYRVVQSQAAPPAYGALVAGGGSLLTFLADFRTAWGGIRALLNANYSTVDYTVAAIVGKRYASPSAAIANLVSSLTAIVHTGVPHGRTTGQLVNIYGVTTPAAVNGTWSITVLSTTSFSLDGSAPFATWSGNGYWQRATGTQELLYEDTNSIVFTDVGGVAGDALPLFVSASIRRIGSKTGRNFRSRLSLSPMSESDSLDGGWIAGTRTAWAAALTAFLNAVTSSGSTDPLQDIMDDAIVSPTLAIGLATPFTGADSWTDLVTSYALQRNSGSIVRRKPRLTVAIN